MRTLTRQFAVDWTSNAAERGMQTRETTSGGVRGTGRPTRPWIAGRTNQSYLISARNHGLSVQEAITLALAGTPWLPQITLPTLAAA